MTTGTRPRSRLGRPERRAAILDAAAATFAEAGYAATSMARVAAAAGVTHLIVYRHFASKDALYEAVLSRAVAALESAWAVPGAVGPYGPTPAAVLRGARADPDAFRVLWRHAAREPAFAAYADAARRSLLELTTGALAPRVGPMQTRWAARATVTYLVEAVLVWIEDGNPRYDERFAAATAAALRAGVRSWAKGS